MQHILVWDSKIDDVFITDKGEPSLSGTRKLNKEESNIIRNYGG
jgi:hypothetical protein